MVHVEFPSGDVSNVALSCDDLTLAVSNGKDLHLYDVKALAARNKVGVCMPIALGSFFAAVPVIPCWNFQAQNHANFVQYCFLV